MSPSSPAFVASRVVLRATAYLACATVVAMLAIFLVTGIGQDPLQFVHPPSEYARILLARPPLLRACIGLDNAFIVFYSVTFLALSTVLLRRGAHRSMVAAATAALLVVALLDFVENCHFLSMLATAETGTAPSCAEISFQVQESLLKFHTSYFGLFVLGLALPRTTSRERLTSNLSVFLQLPVGVLIYVTPPAWAVPLVFVRFTYFAVSLALVGSIFGEDDSSAPASPRDTTRGASA